MLRAVFTNIYLFEIIIIVIAGFVWYLLYKTKFGLHVRACGDNPYAVDAVGIDVGKVRLKAVMILPYVVTLLLLVFFFKHNQSPRALGEIYDKGKR